MDRFPHPELLALLLYRDRFVVFVLQLSALYANRRLIPLAKLIQGLVVSSAEVAGGEGGRIGEAVLRQHRVSQVRLQVLVAVRQLAHEARLDRHQGVSRTAVTRDFLFGNLSWRHPSPQCLLVCWPAPDRPIDAIQIWLIQGEHGERKWVYFMMHWGRTL